MKKIRVQIRHTGTKKLYWPHVQKLAYGAWGFNIYLGGRIFVAVREPRKFGGSTGLIDIDFGKAMLNGMRLDAPENRDFAALTDEERKLTIRYFKDIS